jgi:HPt (histidine-containing phosphotransfer) domain-containing protein
MDDYISKPLKVEDLQRVLERWRPATQPEAAQRLTTASDPASPPVDLNRLREVTGQNEQEMQELVELYLQQTAADIARLQAAIAAGSVREVERLAHGCAGASANCGMVGIAPLFKGLEQAASEDRLTNGTQWCTAVAMAFEHIRDFFQAYKTPNWVAPDGSSPPGVPEKRTQTASCQPCQVQHESRP